MIEALARPLTLRSLSFALAVVACGGAPSRAVVPEVQRATAPRTEAPAETDAPAQGEPAEDAACPKLDDAKLAPPGVEDAIAGVPVPPIVDPKGTMAHFHERLAGLARGAVADRVRIGVYGDSNMTADLMTGHMRRVLQGRLGDGGHGFLLLGRPKGWYVHQNVRRGGTYDAFRNMQVSNDLVQDRHYGFANVAAETSSWGAAAWVATAKNGPVGTKAGVFDVFFFRRPYGGTFDILADGAVVKTIDTRATAFEAAVERVEVPDGPHELRCVSRGRGSIRFVGVAMERPVAGIVVDSLGTGAMNIGQMSWVQSSTRRPMLEKRGYDLVVFHLGTAQSILGQHKEWAKKVIEDVRGALPNATILVLTPPDYLLNRFGSSSDPRIVTVSKQLEEVATELGVAFWDYRAAMGGDGSMRTFVKKKLVSADWVHLTPNGQELMGNRLMHALFTDNAKYRGEHPRAGCE